MGEEKWKRYQTEVLFLLIGTNPLPDYVAACLLAKSMGKILLLATSDTHDIAQQLRSLLKNLERNNQWKIPEPREIDAADGSKIYRRVSEIVKQEVTHDMSIGLNYTGGTKAMAVHAYQAIRDIRPDAVFSYLDAHELAMRIHVADLPDKTIRVDADCEITLQDLIRLHGRGLKSPPKRQPLFLGAARELARRFQDEQFANEWKSWCQSQFKKSNGKWRNKSNLRAVEIPPEGEGPSAVFNLLPVEGAVTLKGLAEKIKESLNLQEWDAEKMAKWLGGRWLEHLVLDAFLQISRGVALHDIGMGLYIEKREPEDSKKNGGEFEFDVAAMRGYQLFAVSCTTSANKGLTKSKLFEAYLRAHQMGGEEAHAALVSMYPDPQKLKTELEESWYTKGHIEVFKPQDILKLPERLEEWIKSASHI